MVCELLPSLTPQTPLGDAPFLPLAPRTAWFLGDPATLSDEALVRRRAAAAQANDPFDDFEDDDFDDEFDDDFEEDWEDDLTEDDEFPDTFGGAEPEEEEIPEPEDSPFADDPDFDDA